MSAAADTRPTAIIHVDLDGVPEIYATHGWTDSHADDPIFETGMPALLDLLDRNRITATLFVIARTVHDPRKREWLDEAVRRGHDIASHTLTHPHLFKTSADRQRREFAESRDLLGSELGVTVRGFRAPGYQIDRVGIEILDELGYAYDSSAFPAPLFAERLGAAVSDLRRPGRPFPGLGLCELPLPDYRPSPVPVNPSYAHLLGMRYFRWGIKRQAARGLPVTLLFHLIDLADPLPPERLPGWKARIFTLSHLPAARKLARCQRMLDCVAERCRITTTNEVVATIGE